MAKDTYYFSHDYNARSDERISFYLSKHGMEGYGIYWLLIEQMHQSADGKLTIALMDGIAYSERVDITLLKECYNTAITCGLFVNDGVKFWSDRVLRNKADLEDSRQKKSKAGLLGMQSRWGNHNTVITTDNTVITKHNKGKESKGKESKVNKREKGTPPDFEEFLNYAIEKKPLADKEQLRFKYQSWVENGWATGKNNPIRNWKSTLLNTLPYINEVSNGERKMVY